MFLSKKRKKKASSYLSCFSERVHTNSCVCQIRWFPVTYETEVRTVLFSAVPRNATGMVSSFLCSSQSELGSGGGGGLIAEPQVTAGLCSHSRGSGGAVWTSLIRELAQRGKRLPKVPLSPSLAGWSLGWPGLELGRALLSQEVCGSAVPSGFLGFGEVSSSPQHSHSVREGTKTLTWSLALNQLKSPCGLLSQAQQPQDWTSTATGLSGCDHLLTHWLILSPYPEALRKCSVPHRLSDVLLLSCSHTHPPLKSRPVL